MNAKRVLLTILAASLVVFGVTSCAVQPGMLASRDAAVEIGTSYIVQADSAQSAAQAVMASGGLVTHELSIIRSVGAMLTSQQRRELEQNDAVRRIYSDVSVSTASI